MADLEDIPTYLRIPQDERRAAWAQARAARPLPSEPKTYRPITGIPGAKDDTDS